MRLKFVALLVSVTVIVLAGAAAALPEKKACSRNEAIEADAQTDKLGDWNSIRSWYVRFSHCDDGGIAESVSDKVAKVFANHWNRLSEFTALAAKDKGFENFVLSHVDETIGLDEATKIQHNARSQCPPRSARLCRALIDRTMPLKQ